MKLSDALLTFIKVEEDRRTMSFQGDSRLQGVRQWEARWPSYLVWTRRERR
jgi:hypothetical protein